MGPKSNHERVLIAEQCFEVAAAVHHTQDQRVFIIDPVHNDVFAHGQAAMTKPEVVLTGTADAGKLANHKEAIGNRVDQAIGNLDAAALPRHVKPTDFARNTAGRSNHVNRRMAILRLQIGHLGTVGTDARSIEDGRAGSQAASLLSAISLIHTSREPARSEAKASTLPSAEILGQSSVAASFVNRRTSPVGFALIPVGRQAPYIDIADDGRKEQPAVLRERRSGFFACPESQPAGLAFRSPGLRRDGNLPDVGGTAEAGNKQDLVCFGDCLGTAASVKPCRSSSR